MLYLTSPPSPVPYLLAVLIIYICSGVLTTDAIESDNLTGDASDVR